MPRKLRKRLSPAECTNWVGKKRVDIREVFVDVHWGNYQHDQQDLRPATRPTTEKLNYENVNAATNTRTEECTTRNLALTSPRPIRPRCAWNPVALVHVGRGSSPGRNSSADCEGDHWNPHLYYGKAEERDALNTTLTSIYITVISSIPFTDLAMIGRITACSRHTIGYARETKGLPYIGINIRDFIMLVIIFTVVNHTDAADTMKETLMSTSTEGGHSGETNTATRDALRMDSFGMTMEKNAASADPHYAKENMAIRVTLCDMTLATEAHEGVYHGAKSEGDKPVGHITYTEALTVTNGYVIELLMRAKTNGEAETRTRDSGKLLHSETDLARIDLTTACR